MALSKTGEPEYIGLDPGLAEARCFYCGGCVYHPAVVWSGPQMLYLHGPCAAQFAVNLAHDAVELRRTHGVPWKRETP